MSDDAPSTCPTCGTAVPAGAAKCPGCGRVFGEANRCPHCHAIAAVRRKGAGYACVACGGEREAGPGVTVLGESGPSRVEQLTVDGVDPASRALARLVRFGGVLLVAAGVTAGAIAFTAPAAPVVVMMVIAAALGIGGVTAMSQASRVESRARDRRRVALEQRVLALAETRGGDLTATIVSKELHLGLAEADAVLTAMADGSRVAVEVDAEGIVHYVFRELRAAAGPKVRVEASAADASAADAAEQDEIAAEAAARVERELQKRERL